MTTAPANEPSTVLRTVVDGDTSKEDTATDTVERTRQQTEDTDAEVRRRFARTVLMQVRLYR